MRRAYEQPISPLRTGLCLSEILTSSQPRSVDIWPRLLEPGMPNAPSHYQETLAFVYVSNALDRDISSYLLQDDGGLVASARTGAGELAMPMAVSPDGARLYLASRAQPFALEAFSIDRVSGGLTRISQCALDESVSFLSLDCSGRYVLTASYVASCVRVFGLTENGSVDAVPLDTHFDIPQAHAIRVDGSNRFAYVPSLGADAVYQFRFDEVTGRLMPLDPPRVQVPTRNGPRHLVVSDDNRFVYVVNEMQASVTTFRRDDSTGCLEAQGSVSGLAQESPLIRGAPPSITHKPSSAQSDGGHLSDASRLTVRAADIQATPDGRFLFISERAGRTIASFGRDRGTGALRYSGSIEVAERPRSFAIDPTGRYLIAAAEIEATIGVYGISPTDGSLKLLGTYPAGKGANWVEIVAAG